MQLLLHNPSQDSSSKSPWKFVIIFSIIFSGIVVGTLINSKFIKSIDEPITHTPDKERVNTVKQTIFFVPVTSFTSTRRSISSDELKTEAFVGLRKYRPLYPKTFTIEFVSSEEELEQKLKEDMVGLIPPQEVRPWYSTLPIDGQNFWSNQSTLSDYPLKVEHMSQTLDERIIPIEDSSLTTIFASGELIPARAVDRLGLNKYNNHSYLFDFFRKDIESADISVGLLENSLLGNPSPCTGCMSFVGDDAFAGGLTDVGYDAVSTAGNHAGDAGQKAYENTIELLDDAGIQITGTGNSNELPQVTEYHSILQPTIHTVNDKKIGMFGADDVAFYYWKKDSNTNTYGTNYVSNRLNGIYSIDTEQISKLAELKELYKLDYMIMYMSWGVEYTNYPTDHQKNLGHTLVDAGVDMIIGSHPHWVQSIEFYNEKPIIYSLGNFLFDQTHTLETRQGMAVNLHYLNHELKNIELMPLQICGYHQTSNDLATEYLEGSLALEDIYPIEESKGCVYWQPKKLKSDHPSYEQILNRVFEYTEI
ncbi:CapA family protein [Candidatus Dojkabacteria bacterium]|uniref:CapA family protein n=1 Tax=Candidatus Dojkabacteria bacterium TaxID=2099670 RepID=A0A955L8R7_9BACT|nr:CapA family protein [Candidatus Dojkabacteria bacterium]